MISLTRIESSNSLNKSESKGNLSKSSSKGSLLEELLQESDDKETNLTYFSEQKIFEEVPWRPPSRTGLRNSEPIIPTYYLQKVTGLFDENGQEVTYMDVDYLMIIKDDIRNFRKLNRFQVDYIKKHLDDKSKNEIIDEFIKVTHAAIDIINAN
jgi:hypothetical protein